MSPIKFLTIIILSIFQVAALDVHQSIFRRSDDFLLHKRSGRTPDSSRRAGSRDSPETQRRKMQEVIQGIPPPVYTDAQISRMNGQFKDKVKNASDKAKEQGSPKPTPDRVVQQEKVNYRQSKMTARRTRLASERAIARTGIPQSMNEIRIAQDARNKRINAAADLGNAAQDAAIKAEENGKWADAAKQWKTTARATAKNQEHGTESQVNEAKVNRAVFAANARAGHESERNLANIADARYKTMVGRYRKSRQVTKDVRTEFSGSDSSDSERSFSDVPRD